MMRFLLRLPFAVALTGFGALAMLVPMAHAIRIGDFFTARIFLDSSLLFLILAAMIGVASINVTVEATARSHLVVLFGVYALMPAMLAYPLYFLVPSTPYFSLYFEMLSSLTTTGATLFDAPGQLSDPVHLWRALVGWLGGFLVLVSAVSVMAPLRLGGFEVFAPVAKETSQHKTAQIRAAGVSERLMRFSLRLAPIYAGVTALLALLLIMSGQRVFVAVVLAMSTLSTSGISPGGGFAAQNTGGLAEVLIFVFFFFAVTRAPFSTNRGAMSHRMLLKDRELRLAVSLVACLTGILFLRHWMGAINLHSGENLWAAGHALWGAMFTVLSFLTTTGFQSADWASAQEWSGLHSAGIVLIGLAIMGGGVATTAGGVKLLRIFALFHHAKREMQKLSFPSSVASAGSSARQMRREGAYVAWLFFTLFMLTIALTLAALTLTGTGFEPALTFAIAALTTTGPLATTVLGDAGAYGLLGDGARAILCVAMILGRLEVLAIIALFTPEFWRS